MENKKGFTIVEILVAIVILGIIMAIAIPSYLNINEKNKEQARLNKIAQIELSAEKWADENNLSSPISIPILQLVNDGYLSADDGKTNEILDPVSNENIICHNIDIYIENNIPNAEYTNKEYTGCEVKLEEEKDSNISITAYKIDGNVIGEKLNINAATNEVDWSNKDVIIETHLLDNGEYSYATDAKFIYSGAGINETKLVDENNNICRITTGATIDVNNCSNIVKISSENIIATINITINTTSGLKTNSKIVKIDKTAPFLNIEYDDSEWTNYLRELNIEVNDGNIGSGIKNVTNNGSTIKIESNGTKIIEVENGNYEIIASDQAGNTSSKIIQIQKVDTTKPNINVQISTSWTNQNRLVTLNGEDVGNDASGIKGYYISKNRITNYNQVEEKDIINGNTGYLKDNGNYYIYAIDNAKNITEATFSDKNYYEEKKIDREIPTVSIAFSDTTTTSAKINITGSDSYGEIEKYEIYSNNVLQQIIYSSSETASYSMTNLKTSSNYNILVKIYDKAGNTKEVSKTLSTKLSPFYYKEFTISVVRKRKGIYSNYYITSSNVPNMSLYKTATIRYIKSYTNHHTGEDGDSNLQLNGTEIDVAWNGTNTNWSGSYTYNLNGTSSLHFRIGITADASDVSASYKINITFNP